MSGFLIKPLLFACGPFFYYPWKGLLNLTFGDSYKPAFKHFKVSHRGVTNLSLHMVCLVIQITANFGLLRIIDEQYVPQPVKGIHIVSALSAAAWILQLLPAPAPITCTIGAVASILMSYAYAPAIPVWQTYDNLVFSLYVIVYLFANFGLSKRKIPTKMLTRWGLILSTLYFGGKYLMENYQGSQEVHKQSVQIGLLALLSLISLLPQPVAKMVITGTLLGRFGSILTGDSALFYLSYAFVGSLCQGISHQSTGEEATLLALERRGESSVLAFELAHVTYFPTILLHTVQDALMGKK